MSAWGESFGLAWGQSWGSTSTVPQLAQPWELTVNTGHECFCVNIGESELELNTGCNYLDIEEP